MPIFINVKLHITQLFYLYTMRSLRGASVRCGRPAINRADPTHEFNKNIFVRSGFGTILENRIQVSWVYDT